MASLSSPMASRTLPARRAVAFALLLGLVGSAGFAASPPDAERGFPLVHSYQPQVDGAATENFAVAQGAGGLLYVGNLSGLLSYDGAWWRLIVVAGGTAALSVASDRAGRVGVGAVDDFGYLAVGEDGSPTFASLKDRLPAGDRELGDVIGVHPVAGGFAFLSERRLALWQGGAVRSVAQWPEDGPTPASFRIDDTVYVWTADGLSRLEGTRLEEAPGGARFRGRRIDLMLPAGPGRALVAVRGEGLFRLDLESGAVSAVSSAASRWVASNQATSGCRLPDGRWALGSQKAGLLLLAADGRTEQVIDRSVGLPDDFVTGVLADREGFLWIASSGGLARLEVGSPLSVIDARAGLEGAVFDVARHRERLWVATSAGLFASAPDGEAGPGLSGVPRMEPVVGVPGPVWSFAPVGRELLVGTSQGVWVLGDGAPRLVPGTAAATAYLLVRSREHPDRVWVGMRDGLGAVRHEPDGWRWEGKLEGVPRYVRSLVERGPVLWCGTTFDGVVRVGTAAPDPFSAPPQVHVEGEEAETGLYDAGDRILATRDGRVLALDEATGRLVADPALASLPGRGQVFALAVDAAGNLWMNTIPPAVAPPRGSGWAGERRALVAVPARDIQSLVAESDGVVWICTDNGLFRHAGSLRGETEVSPPAPLLSRVTLAGGRLLWGGMPGVAPPPAVLGPEAGRLRLELAPASFRSGLHFQTRLDPIDPDWSPPTAEPAVELGRLPARDYTFRVRTVGAGGVVGPETEWTFEVLPPWYRTSWALALAALMAGTTVIGYGRWRGRALRRRSERLAAQVADRTSELTQTVEELSRTQAELREKNQLLAQANERLEELTLIDELTGIANRRRLQQALQEEWSRARRYRQPLALVLVDFDHFKSLNDSRGHVEGDHALRAVARYLAAEVRRTGDLVARYGGEEFALLLPATTLARATELAERLRRGIESLAIPHPGTIAGRITASFGVASVVPPADGGADEPNTVFSALVETADAALYRAKAEGRNKVCA